MTSSDTHISISPAAGRASRVDCASFCEALGAADGDALDALVAVMREPGDVLSCVFAAPVAHLQCG